MLKNQHNIDMDQFNAGNFINKFNYTPKNPNKGGVPNNPANSGANPEMNFPNSQNSLIQNIVRNAVAKSAAMKNFNSSIANLKMNNLPGLERSTYLKDLMNLPKDMEEVLVLIQNKTATNGEITKLLTNNINMSTLAELIQKNGKEAMNKLVLVMSDAAKQGISDTSQIKDALKLINASIAVAGQDNPNQTLKSFMLLYLPWLPLQEGVDFDLEIEGSEGGESGSECSITIMISTKNYGNVKVTIVLLLGNSMSIIVNCSNKFPKEELLKRINAESKSHSMQAEVNFEQKEVKKTEDTNTSRQAKISMSDLKEVNPFMLLMANAIIRHTIDLDNQAD